MDVSGCNQYSKSGCHRPPIGGITLVPANGITQKYLKFFISKETVTNISIALIEKRHVETHHNIEVGGVKISGKDSSDQSEEDVTSW